MVSSPATGYRNGGAKATLRFQACF